MTDILTRRRRKVDTARAHLEQSQRQQPEVDRVAQPLRNAEQLNHLAAKVQRSLRGQA